MLSNASRNLITNQSGGSPELDPVDGEQQLVGRSQFGESRKDLAAFQPRRVVGALHASPHHTQDDLQQHAAQLLLRPLGGDNRPKTVSQTFKNKKKGVWQLNSNLFCVIKFHLCPKML